MQDVSPVTSDVKLAFKLENIIPTVEHGGGSAMVWVCDYNLVHQRIQKENVRPSVCDLILNPLQLQATSVL